MRKTIFTLLALATLAGCSKDSVAPADSDSMLLDDAAVLAYGAADMAEPGSHYIARLHRLPDNLKLTADQQARIRSALQAFEEATRSDRAALTTIIQQARAAHQAGKSPEEVRAILAQGDDIRRRLHTAEQNLHAQIEAILTPEQKAWLAANGPGRCREFALTEAQKTQITGLIAAFNEANRADLQTIKTVFQEARAAHENGANRNEIARILSKAAPAMLRVRAAQVELASAIRAVLTPEQRASGCYAPRIVVNHR
jgi:Spy/CpxP family protein refolding chaperone